MASEIDTLIQQLHSGGELDAEGGFTLDREKAREKMRQFQLADPRQYVLLLVSAAVLRGATRIDFRIDTDDVHMRFDRAFDAADMDALYTSLFGAKDDPVLRPRQELALALNAAMALEPAFARVSGASEEGVGVRLTARPDLPDEIQDDVRGLHPGTHIHIKDRLRARNVVRFFRNLGGTIDEEVHLRERCRWSEVPIFLDGRPISEGPSIPGALVERWVDVAGGRALAGFVDLEQPARVDFVVAGMWIAEHRLEQFPFPAGFRAIVSTTSLRKDVSQGDVVRDAAYDEVLAALRDASYDVLAMALPRVAAAHGSILGAPAWLREVVRGYLAAFGSAVLQARIPITRALAELEVWKTLGGQTRSTAELVADHEQVGHVRRRFSSEIPRAHQSFVLLDEQGWRDAFRSVFEGREVDRTAQVERRLERESAKRAFLARRHPPRVGETVSRARHAFRVDGDGRGRIEGEVALVRDRSQPARFVIIKDGCALWELTSTDLPVGGLVVVVQADVVPVETYDRAKRDAALARALLATAGPIHAVMDELASSLSSEHRDGASRRDLVSHLSVCFAGGLEARILEIFGFEGSQIRSYLARHEAHALAPRVSNDLAGRAWAHAPLFGTADRSVVSVVDVERSRGGSGPIFVITPKLPSAADLPHLVLRLASNEIELLQTIFGEKNVVLWDGVYMRLLAKRTREARPEDPLEPRGDCVVGPSTFTLTDARVCVGLVRAERGSNDGGPARVRVLTDHRDVCDIEVSCPVDGVTAAVDVDDLETNTAWSELRGIAARRRVAEVVYFGLAALMEATAAGNASSPDECLALLAAAAVPMASETWSRVHRVLRDERDEVGARDELAELAGLVDAAGLEIVDDVLRRLLQTRTPPTARAVREHLQRRREVREVPAVALAPLRRRMLDLWPRIEGLPLLRTVVGSTSLAAVQQELQRRGRVYYIAEGGEHALEDPPDRLVLRLDPAARSQCERIFGADVLEDGTSWLEAWNERRALERRAELPALVLDANQTLVALSVDDDRIQGQLGLPRAHPRSATTSIVVCHGRRPITRISPRLAVPLVGIVGAESFGSESGFTSVSGTEEDRISRLCTRSMRALWKVLADGYAALSGDRRELADAWVVHAFRLSAAGTRANPGRLQGGIGVLAHLPVLETLGQSRISFEALRRAHGNGQVQVASDRRLPPTEAPVIVIRSPDEREALQAVFGELRDYEAVVAEKARIERRKRSAPPLPSPPARPLVVEEVSGRGLSGKLWIDARSIDDARVSFGAEGKLVTALAVSELLACEGAIEGPGVEVSSTWEEVQLKRRQRQLLVRKIIGMYDGLVDRHLAALTGEQETSEPSLRQRLRELIDRPEPKALERVLRRALLGMHAEVREGRVWSGERHRKLYRRLAETPLLELGTGRTISLDVALRERPMELAELGLSEEISPPEPIEGEGAGLQGLARLLGAALDGSFGSPEVPASGRRSTSPPDVTVPSAARAVASTPAPEPPVAEPPPLAEPPSAEPPSADSNPVLTASARLLDAIRSELRMVRAGNRTLLDDAHLDLLCHGAKAGSAAVYVDDGALVLNERHPAVARALTDFEDDPMWVSFLASAVYSTLNAWLVEVTDPDELEFHRLHAIHVASAFGR